MKLREAFWAQWWGASADEFDVAAPVLVPLRERLIEEGTGLEPITGEQLSSINKKERSHAGLGGDAWAPASLDLLPD